MAILEFNKESTHEHFKIEMLNVDSQKRLIERLKQMGFNVTIKE